MTSHSLLNLDRSTWLIKTGLRARPIITGPDDEVSNDCISLNDRFDRSTYWTEQAGLLDWYDRSVGPILIFINGWISHHDRFNRSTYWIEQAGLLDWYDRSVGPILIFINGWISHHDRFNRSTYWIEQAGLLDWYDRSVGPILILINLDYKTLNS